jgi:predicted Zn-dependent protease
MPEDDQVQALAERAERAYDAGDAPLALELLGRALARRPADPQFLRLRARILVEQERFAEAERDAARGLQAAPDDPELLLYHGSALVGRAAFDAALLDFAHLRDLMPENPNLHVNCAEMALWLDDYAAAEAGFTLALGLDPANVAAHFGLARVCAKGRRCAESREWLQRLVALRNPAAGRLLLEIADDSCFRYCREQDQTVDH